MSTVIREIKLDQLILLCLLQMFTVIIQLRALTKKYVLKKTYSLKAVITESLVSI